MRTCATALRQSQPALLLLALLLALAAAAPQAPAATAQATGTYSNPLPVQIPEGGLVESCADPSIIRGQTPGDSYWYMFCTTDPLNDSDRAADGSFNFRLIPILRSRDLVNWTYVGDVFSERPDWVADDAGLWAPAIEYFNGKYHLYYTAPRTDLPGGGSAIGVAVSPTPAGPWLDSGAPAVEPHDAYCCPGQRRWVFDADVIEHQGRRYIYYGSYFGGISIRELSADGLRSNPDSQQLVALDNRYEGPYVVQKDGYFYLFASATNCCNGPLTGYSIFAGRSTSPFGPFVDRDGVSLLDSRVGGTPVLSMNGNRWVGPGHNAVFQDLSGQWWTVYHAIDRHDPYFAGATGFTRRPVLLDAVDWVAGWPVVRGGRGISDTPQHAPAAQPGDKTAYRPQLALQDRPGRLLSALSDEFHGDALSSQWGWANDMRPAAESYGLNAGALRWETQSGDLWTDRNDAAVLAEPAPAGNYMVETRLRLNLPPAGCCFNYTQAGLVIYGDDDNYVKLTHVSIWNTRQTEFAKEEHPVPAGYPRYGNTVVSAPGEWTYLRIVKRTVAGEEHYTAYTSRDGERWNRGGTWTHQLGAAVRIGLVSMAGAGYTAEFDYVRVYRLQR